MFGMTLAFILGKYWIIIIGPLISFISLTIHTFRSSSGLPLKIGYANIVTLIRLIILLFLISFNIHFSDFQLFIGFLTVIVLDGLDGYLARRFNQATEIGLHLDMEVDALLVFLLSYLHFYEGSLGYWILIPGSMRYVFEILIRILRISAGNYPPKFVRASIAVFFFLSLLTPFVLNEIYFKTICIFSSLLIAVSFLLSIISALVNTEGQ